MRTVLTMSEKQMPEWRAICKAYAKKHGAELIFVNETSCGIEKDGQFRHIYIEEMYEELMRK